MSYEEDRARRIKEVRRQRRRIRRINTIGAVTASVLVVIAAIGVIFLWGALGSLGIYVGWNLGVRGLARACSTHVHTIGYWTAFGTSFALSALRRLLSPPSDVKVSSS